MYSLLFKRTNYALAKFNPNDYEGLSDISDIVSLVISILLWGIGIIGVIMIIAIGFQFMTAKEAEDRQRLKSKAIWFLIGTGIVLLSATIWTVLKSVFSI